MLRLVVESCMCGGAAEAEIRALRIERQRLLDKSVRPWSSHDD